MLIVGLFEEQEYTMPCPKLRKWNATEDRQLLHSVNEYIAVGAAPDYRIIAKKIHHRSPKQCRERYENSLQPDVKRGEWSYDETLTLAKLMTVHGQNWAAVKDQLKTRTYNAIKKKGRKLLGEIVDRNSIPKGTTSKATASWSDSEFSRLLRLHLDQNLAEGKKNDYLYFALMLKSGRSEAEIERRLIQKCCCEDCLRLNKAVLSFECHDELMPDVAGFKERWSLWKAAEVVKRLEDNPEKISYRGTRRASTISTSSGSTFATTSTASKRRKVDDDNWSQGSGVSVQEELFPFSFGSVIASPVSELEMPQDFNWPNLSLMTAAPETLAPNEQNLNLNLNFNFNDETNLPTITTTTTNINQGVVLKEEPEFDLSFLFPL